MKIVFGVFDWGIGHATRDIPLITELLKTHQVHILSTGPALKILKDYFQDKCHYYDVPSIYPPFTKTPFFKLKFTLSLPQMFASLKYARKKSRKIIRQGFDKVISDCRYDVYDQPDNSYLINHQLRFKTPLGVERIFEKWLAMRMKRYKYIIVPDFPNRNLTGELSHNLRYLDPDKIKYIGICSQVRKINTPEDIDYFISLSGPHVQRTILARKIIPQLNLLKGKIVIAGGNPAGASNIAGKNFRFFCFLPAKKQENILNRARFIITRPGYTTVMELVELNKKRVLFLPTPGQTEQEYLADYYEKQRCFHHVSQYRLKLTQAIEKSRGFSGFNSPWKTERSVKEFMKVINS